MYILLLQVEEKVASEPGLTVVGTRSKLAWMGPYMSGRDVSIVKVIVDLTRDRKVNYKLE